MVGVGLEEKVPKTKYMIKRRHNSKPACIVWLLNIYIGLTWPKNDKGRQILVPGTSQNSPVCVFMVLMVLASGFYDLLELCPNH